MNSTKKLSIIYVLKVLLEYSDADHFLTQNEIADKIRDIYGLEVERKSIGSSLALLQELNYDIVRGSRGGFAIIARSFDASEVKFLVDAIFSSKSISGKQAKQLCGKLSDLLSRYQRKDYEYLIKSTELTRTDNKDVFYNIEIINEAIKNNKWVGFKYLTYDDNGNQVTRFNDYVYHASPCYLVNNYGKYYLLAYRHKYNSVSAYRLDNMKDVIIMEDRGRIDPRELEEFKNYPSISEYLNDHIYLFGTKVVEAEIELVDSYSLSYVKEWFGDNASVFKTDGKLHAKMRCDEQAFLYWFLQYGEHFKLLSPEELKGKIVDAAGKVIENCK